MIHKKRLFYFILCIGLSSAAAARTPSDLKGCELGDLLFGLGVDPYAEIARLLTFGVELSGVAHDINRVGKSEFTQSGGLVEEIFSQDKYKEMFGMHVVPQSVASSALDDLRKDSAAAILMDENKDIGFFSYAAYASLVLHGPNGMLPLGDVHDVYFHLPSLLDKRVADNLKRRSEIGLRHFSAVTELFERRGVTISRTPLYARQGFDVRVSPWNQELNNILESAEMLFDFIRFVSWEHLPNLKVDRHGRYDLRLLGGLGHNLTIYLAGFTADDFSSSKIKWLLRDAWLFNKIAFFFPKHVGMWSNFLATSPPSWPKYQQALADMGLWSEDDLEKRYKEVGTKLGDRRPTGEKDADRLKLWFISELAQVIGESPQARLLFDYEARQSLAARALDVYEEFVSFHVGELKKMK